MGEVPTMGPGSGIWDQRFRVSDEDRTKWGSMGIAGFAYGVARTTIGLLLLEYAAWTVAATGDREAVAAAARWCERPLAAFEKGEGPVPSPVTID